VTEAILFQPPLLLAYDRSLQSHGINPLIRAALGAWMTPPATRLQAPGCGRTGRVFQNFGRIATVGRARSDSSSLYFRGG
jgi:hypothetical protein